MQSKSNASPVRRSPPPAAGQSPKQSTRQINSAVARDDLVSCKYCSRRFAPDRLPVHENICARTAKKQRKMYDPVKHRIAGTDAANFFRSTKKPGTSQKIQMPKSNWRLQHQEFVDTIKAAKRTQEHLAAGGNLRDLPPPPPSSNPDYVQCPHCGRRFNEAAAERHIPKCATYLYNKPKSNVPPPRKKY